MPVKETNLIMKAKDFQSSFLSCPKDIEEILRKLFLSSKPFSDDLKRLLVINTKDCLDNKTEPLYNQKINAMSLAKLRQDEYIKLEPKIKIPEHEEEFDIEIPDADAEKVVTVGDVVDYIKENV